MTERWERCQCPTDSLRMCKRRATRCYVKDGLCIRHVCAQHFNSVRWVLLRPDPWTYDKVEWR